jgi:hypothetical protein
MRCDLATGVVEADRPDPVDTADDDLLSPEGQDEDRG